MSEYKRFIAYFYEYINGEKQKNAGFAKVELRNGMWRILFRLTIPEAPEPPVQVFGFVREGEYLLGIPLGTMNPGCKAPEEWAWRADTPVGKEHYYFEQMNGIRIVSGDGREFITVWDDEPVILGRFVRELPEASVTERQYALVENQLDIQVGRGPEQPKVPVQPEMPELPGEPKAPEQPEEPGQHGEPEMPKPSEEPGQLGESEVPELPEESHQPEKPEPQDIPGFPVRPELPPEKEPLREPKQPPEIEPSRESEQPLEIEPLQEPELPPESKSSQKPEESLASDSPQNLELQRMAGLVQSIESQQIPEAQKESQKKLQEELQKKQQKEFQEELQEELQKEPRKGFRKEPIPPHATEAREPRAKEEMSDEEFRQALRKMQNANWKKTDINRNRHNQVKQNPAERLIRSRQRFQPFRDNEFTDCVQIKLCDILPLQQENWKVGRSNFLQHGYYLYRHLLLGRTKDGQYILGVPGMCNQQEEYMAQMFGYDHFKIAASGGCRRRFGYWYRIMEEPERGEDADVSLMQEYPEMSERDARVQM
ncbi:MAG: hypothetical protein LUG99_04900 [Lachnospiraceae bacterium]|nr:hypothetical protein [Lachnospiraceae bacterium]